MNFIIFKGKIKNKIGYIPSNHVCTFERGEKLMTLIEAVEVFDEKMRVKSPIKLAKNQVKDLFYSFIQFHVPYN